MMRAKCVPIRIRREYFNDIVAGNKPIEYRKYCPFWAKRLSAKKDQPLVAVFLCGKDVHRRLIDTVHHIITPSWFSAQGRRDVPTPTCFAIHLGRELRCCYHKVCIRFGNCQVGYGDKTEDYSCLKFDYEEKALAVFPGILHMGE